MSKNSVLIAAAVSLALFGGTTQAQNQHKNQERGFSANGVYSSDDLDSVNLFNGNLILHIPVGGRYRVGSNLSYSLTLFYNSTLWTQKEVCQYAYIDESNPDFFPPYAAHYIDGHNFHLEEAVYDDSHNVSPRGFNDNGCVTSSIPNPAANAGMGWQFSLGKLYDPRANTTVDTPSTTERKHSYVYQSPDGSEHAFYPTPHEGEPDDAGQRFWYTRDSSYLRMEVGVAGGVRIDFPDGTSHYFVAHALREGNELRLTRMVDQFGNWVTVEYQDTSGDGIADDKWIIRDSARDSLPGAPFQEIIFRAAGPDYQKVISEVRLLATGTQTAVYRFSYENRSIERAVPYASTRPDLPVYKTVFSAPFLTSIELPDGSRYTMPVDTSYDLTGDKTHPGYKGILTGLTRPTGASVEWQYKVPGMDRAEGYGYFYPFVSSARNYLRRSVGVRRRIVRVDGETFTWMYDPRPEPLPATSSTSGGTCSASSMDPGCASKEFVNTVTTPQGDRTVNYFSTYPHPFNNNSGRGEADWHVVEYGLPLTKYDHGLPAATDTTGKRLFLSQQIYAANSTTPDLSVYVRYETDVYPLADGFGSILEANSRMAATRAVYHDDAEGGVTRFTETQYGSFDGLGNYRRVETLGNFDGDAEHADDSRAVFTNYNPSSGEYRADPSNNTLATNFTPVSEGSRWILKTFDQVVTRDNQSNSKSAVSYHFNAQGVLQRKRTLKLTSAAASSPSAGANDIVVDYAYSTGGELIRELYYGGDKQGGLGTGALANLSLGRYGYEYGMVHTYAPGGVLASSQYIRAGSGADVQVSFKSVDRDIDGRTGLVLTERDTAGDPVQFRYDAMWRVTRSQPRQGSRMDIVYTRLGGVLPSGTTASRPTVNVYHRPNAGGAALDDEAYEYDGLGRVRYEWHRMADGSQSGRETLYNGMGWKKSVSELGNFQKKTEYLYFDPHGRPGTVSTADGKLTDFNYFGVRRTRRIIRGVMTPGATTGTGVERDATFWEHYDIHGRLERVREPSGIGDALVATFYGYDEGGRLAGVSTTATVQEISGAQVSVTQIRSFDYDGIGNLRGETHPELGASGNGTITYGDYNSKGRVGSKTDGVNTLRYSYDVADRPSLVEERKSEGTYRPLKSYNYYGGQDNDYAQGRYVGGKLSAATRHNWIRNPASTSPDENTNVTVAERYEYYGLDGKMSKRRTEVSSGAYFEQTFNYGPLGNLVNQTYPQCTAETPHCYPVATPRTVGYSYSKGMPTRVFSGTLDYASSISYHGNGQVNEVARGNNTTDKFYPDPNSAARPARIRTRYNAGDITRWDSGTYQYDAAGNVHRAGNDWHFYDLVGRVKDSSIRELLGQKQVFRYDAFGNLRTLTTYEGVTLSWERVKGTAQIDTNAATNRMRGVTYDAQGNATGPEGNPPLFTYDALNMMKYAPNRTYVYGPNDERLWIYDKSSGVMVETITLRGRNEEVLREYTITNGNAAGNWWWAKDYIHGAGRLLATEANAAAPYNRLHYHVDHLGSPRAVTDANGHLVSKHQYWPFGDEDPLYAQQDSERLKFTGHERDFGAAVDYMHARYYHYRGGKFLSVDPGRDFDPPRPQSWNLYAYVRNSPTNRVDPDGRIGMNPFNIRAAYIVHIVNRANRWLANPRVQNAMRTAWSESRLGASDVESSFRIDSYSVNIDGQNVETDLVVKMPHTNEANSQSVRISSLTASIWHTHPNRGTRDPSTPENNALNDPQKGDTKVAEDHRIQIFVMHKDGLTMYDPFLGKVFVLREGRSWLPKKR